MSPDERLDELLGRYEDLTTKVEALVERHLKMLKASIYNAGLQRNEGVADKSLISMTVLRNRIDSLVRVAQRRETRMFGSDGGRL